MSYSGDADDFLTELGLETQHIVNNILMKDWKTRLFIPQQVKEISGLSLGTELQSIVTGNGIVQGGFSESINYSLNNLGDLATSVINIPFLILGVTNIRFSNEHVIPTTKGIGSTGEILHLLGTKNEQITISFTTNRFPSVFGKFLRDIINKTLERASFVYIIDEMTGIIPCILKSYNISKQAELPGAIQGELSFITIKQTGLSQKELIDKLSGGRLNRANAQSALRGVRSRLSGVGDWIWSVVGVNI